MALGLDGTLYVSDTHNDRVLKLSGTGAYLGTIGSAGSGDGQYDGPGALAIGPTGNLFVVDSAHNRVDEFQPDGTPVGAATVGGAIGDIAVDPATGSLYILHGWSDGHMVTKYPAGAGPPQQLIHFDETPEDHVNPQALAVGSGQLYIELWTFGSAVAHDWIQCYDTSGHIEATSFGDVYDSAYLPQLALGQDGNLYSAGMNEDACRYSPGGALLHRWASASASHGHFKDPADVAVARSGSVYVLDSGNSRVQQMTSAGAFVRAWGGAGSSHGKFRRPQGITVAPDGTVYVADTGNNRVQRFSATGAFLMSWGTRGTGAGKFNAPLRVVVTKDKHAYVLDQRVRTVGEDDEIEMRRVQRFKVGAHTAKAAIWKRAGWHDSSADWLALSASEKVYFANGRWSATGHHLGKVVLKPYTEDVGIAVDGTIYGVDGGADCFVRKYKSNGSLAATHGAWGVTKNRFIYPRGIAVSSKGRVYVADSDNNRVQVFSIR